MSDGGLPARGVQFLEPPPSALPALSASIDRAIAAANLPPTARGTVVAIADQRGVNAALVAKTPGGWDVVGWVAKAWGEPQAQYGAAVRKVW